LIPDLLHFLFTYNASRNQLICITFWLSIHRPDLLVHNRLRKTGLINFIVTIESEPDHINQYVLLKSLPISYHELRASDYRFGVASVYSQNGNTERFNDIRRIFETSVVFWTRCEADLVICNDMQTAITTEFG
jgi:hypothetical protein